MKSLTAIKETFHSCPNNNNKEKLRELNDFPTSLPDHRSPITTATAAGENLQSSLCLQGTANRYQFKVEFVQGCLQNLLQLVSYISRAPQLWWWDNISERWGLEDWIRIGFGDSVYTSIVFDKVHLQIWIKGRHSCRALIFAASSIVAFCVARIDPNPEVVWALEPLTEPKLLTYYDTREGFLQRVGFCTIACRYSVHRNTCMELWHAGTHKLSVFRIIIHIRTRASGSSSWVRVTLFYCNAYIYIHDPSASKWIQWIDKQNNNVHMTETLLWGFHIILKLHWKLRILPPKWMRLHGNRLK